MKKISTLLVLFLLFTKLEAQNVGIGELSPGSKLSVKGNLSVGANYSNLTTNLPVNGLIVEGNVGIGIAAPTSQLHTSGSVRFQTLGGSGNRYVRTDNIGSLSAVATIPWTDITGVPPFITSFTEVDPSWNGTANTTSNIGRTGSVGIGTLSPGEKLHVAGNVWVSESDVIIDRPNTTGGWARGLRYFDTGLNSGTELAGIGLNGSGTTINRIYLTIGDNPWSNPNGINISSNGNVGIGTITPTAQLHTTGTVRLQNLGGGGNRYVRTDNNGLLSATATVPWTDITGAPTIVSNEIDPTWNGLADPSGDVGRLGNVGIGSSTAPHKLFVSGGRSYFSTNSGSDPVTIARAFKTSNFEELQIGINDNRLLFQYINDENLNGIDFQLTNTDTEINGGINANDQIVMSLISQNGGSVGIGTTAPTAQLHTTSTVRLQNLGGGGNRYVRTDNNGLLSATATVPWTDITGAPTIVSTEVDPTWNGTANETGNVGRTGNVGFGTTTPSSKIEVVGGSVRLPTSGYEGSGQIQSSGIVRFANGGAAQAIYTKQLSASASWADNDTYTQINGIYSSGNFRAGGTTLALFANTSTGQVGIGTSAPTQALDVNGQVRIRGGAPAVGRVLTATSSNGTAAWQTPIAHESASAATNGTGWKRIATVSGSAGRGFGKISLFTTGGSFTPAVTTIHWFHDWSVTAKLWVHSEKENSLWNAVRITDDGTNSYIEVNFITDINTLSTLSDSYGWRAATLYSGNLPDGGGNVRATATDAITNFGENTLVVAFNKNVGIGVDNPTFKLHVNGRLKTNGINETSDKRLKRNITPLQQAMKIVNALQGVNYYWDKEKHPEMNFDESLQYGLIAQEVEKVMPDIVHTDADGYKSVQYTQLIAVLIEALKEQHQESEQFKTSLTQMKTELNDIKNRLDDLDVST